MPRIEGRTREPLPTWKRVVIAVNILLTCVAAFPLVCLAFFAGPFAKFLASVTAVISGSRDVLFAAFGWLFVTAMSETPNFAWCIGLLVAIFVSACGLALIPKMPKVVRLVLAPVQGVLCVFSIRMLYMVHSQPLRHM